MRNAIYREFIEKKEKPVIHMVTCSVCGKRIGCFATHDGYYSSYTKRIPDSLTEYYTITRSQPNMSNYYSTIDDNEFEQEDVHPDCLPKYMETYVERERDHDDYMELNIEHKFEYQSMITDEEKSDDNDKET